MRRVERIASRDRGGVGGGDDVSILRGFGGLRRTMVVEGATAGLLITVGALTFADGVSSQLIVGQQSFASDAVVSAP